MPPRGQQLDEKSTMVCPALLIEKGTFRKSNNSFAGSEVGSISQAKRQIGTVSAFFLVFNRMVGTGIFATPSTIFSLSGSVGLSLFIWVAGMIIAGAGMAVYLEFGTGLPRNGGEKNYLEFVYRKPKYLATGFYTGYVILLGTSTAMRNSGGMGDVMLTACF